MAELICQCREFMESYFDAVTAPHLFGIDGAC